MGHRIGPDAPVLLALRYLEGDIPEASAHRCFLRAMISSVGDKGELKQESIKLTEPAVLSLYRYGNTEPDY